MVAKVGSSPSPSSTSQARAPQKSQSLGSAQKTASAQKNQCVKEDGDSLTKADPKSALLSDDKRPMTDDALNALPGAAQRMTAQQLLDQARSGTLKDPMPAEQYFGSKELTQIIDATHGPGSAGRIAKAEQLFQRGELAFEAARGGASKQDVIKMLGADNPEAPAMAAKIMNLAKVVNQQPMNEAAATKALAEAHYAFIKFGAPGDATGQAALKQLFQQEYGVSSPSQLQYGQGPLANAAGAASFAGTSPTGGSVLDIAQSQVGIREATGNNDGIPSQRYSNGRKEPWCANFVAWTFRQSGNPLPGNQRRLASVQHMEDQMKAAGRWSPRDATTPRPGDVIFFANRGDSDSGPGRHVGIVEKVENGRVYTIEGNSGNRVARRSYPLNHPRISGWGAA